MDLSKILAVSGRPGLYKMLTQTKNGLVVESMLDGKRLTVFSHERISSLEEISIFTTDDDIPLKDVLQSIFKMQNGEEAISHKSSSDQLRDFFVKAVPNYDKDSVYVSDMKKVIQWYNLLHKAGLLEFEEEKDEKEEKEEKDGKENNAQEEHGREVKNED